MSLVNQKINEISSLIEQISKYSNRKQDEQKLTLDNFVFSHLCNRDVIQKLNL